MMGTTKGKVTVNRTLVDSAQTLLDGLRAKGWNSYTQGLAKRLQDELMEKYEADKRRNLYTTFKDKTRSKEEQEIARNLYLDSAGMREDFRWKESESPHDITSTTDPPSADEPV
jgi:hypothetical protein